MNPRAVKARNYRTFERLDLELPEGCVAILGANGAGKSSVANIPDLCLFGPEGRSWAPYLTQGAESTELELELVFDHGSREDDPAIYRVRRGYSSRGSGKTTLDLEKMAVDGNAAGGATWEEMTWLPLTRETQPATQALLEELLGMTRETFRASSMLVQGDGAAFTEAQPRDRKRVLSKILGLERYEALADLARADRRTAENGIERLAGELEAADRELLDEDGGDRIASTEAILNRIGAITAATGAMLDAGKAELAALAEAVTAGEALSRRKAEALARRATASAGLLALEQRVAEADAAQVDLATIQDEVATLTTTDQAAELERRKADLEGQVEVYRAECRRVDEIAKTRELRQAEKATVEAQAAVKTEAALSLDRQVLAVETGDLVECVTCGQELGAIAKAATLSSLRASVQVIEDEAKAIRERAVAIEIPSIPEPPLEPNAKTELEAVTERIAKARQDEIQRARLEGRAQILRQRAGSRPSDAELSAARLEAQKAVVAALDLSEAPSDQDLDVARANALAAQGRIYELEASLREAELNRVATATGLERLRDLRDRSAAARGMRETLQREIDALAVLERAYGRDGIPALIIARVAIPAIEVEAGRILAELGTSYRVELRTEKALAGGRTADALDVVIVTEDGERPYETFSGGERTRINLAVRIALARLLAHRRGAESRLLVIDEPEYLDQAGTAALAVVLQGLASDFARIYLISHVPELRDSLDAAIEVSRGPDGYSKIGGIE